MTDTFNFVKDYCTSVKNDRTLRSVFDWGRGEMQELKFEVDRQEENLPAGDDGIVGEAVDVITCMIDLIHQQNPGLTSEQFHEILRLKCEKWKTKYHNPKFDEEKV